MRLGSVTFLVRDYDEAIAWFVGVLEFVFVEDSDLGDGKRWVVVAPSRDATGFLLGKATGEQTARVGGQTGGRVAFFLETESFDDDFARMRDHGVRFVEEPRVEPYGTVAVFEDLYGNRWDLIEKSQ